MGSVAAAVSRVAAQVCEDRRYRTVHPGGSSRSLTRTGAGGPDGRGGPSLGHLAPHLPLAGRKGLHERGAPGSRRCDAPCARVAPANRSRRVRMFPVAVTTFAVSRQWVDVVVCHHAPSRCCAAMVAGGWVPVHMPLLGPDSATPRLRDAGDAQPARAACSGGGGQAATWCPPGLMSAPGPARTSGGSPHARATSMVKATGLTIVSRTGEKRVRAASSAICSSSNSPATLMFTWICS